LHPNRGVDKIALIGDFAVYSFPTSTGNRTSQGVYLRGDFRSKIAMAMSWLHCWTWILQVFFQVGFDVTAQCFSIMGIKLLALNSSLYSSPW
jgi:hypothetical protein